MRLINIIALVTLLNGCAAITTGQNQSISVDSSPRGAECSLTNDDGSWFVGSTPGSVVVERAYSDLTIKCEKGKLRGSEVVKSSTKGIAFGNVIFGGIIGGAVDAGTGAAYDYPPMINVKLKE